MKTSHWKAITFACAASLLAMACTKDAESKRLEAAPENPAPIADKAAAEPVVAAPEAALAGEGAAVEAKADETANAGDAPGSAAPAAPKAPVRSFKPGAPAADKAEPRGGGQVITTETYTVTIKAPAATSGAEGAIDVVLVPKTGWKINMEFPTKLTVVPPAGVTMAKPKLKKADAATFTEKKAIFKVKFKAAAAGEKSFTGKFKFAVCTESTCDPKTAKLAFNVPVK